jgi:hypothetical protein
MEEVTLRRTSRLALALWSFPRVDTVIQPLARTTTTTIAALAAQMGTDTGLLAIRALIAFSQNY